MNFVSFLEDLEDHIQEHQIPLESEEIREM